MIFMSRTKMIMVKISTLYSSVVSFFVECRRVKFYKCNCRSVISA